MNDLGQILTTQRGFVRAMLLAIVIGFPTAVHAQHHGGTIQKSCIGPGGTRATVHPGNQVTCTLTFTNDDSFGDPVRVDGIVDDIHHGGASCAVASLPCGPTCTEPSPVCSATGTRSECKTPNLLFQPFSTTTLGAHATTACVGTGAACTLQSDCGPGGVCGTTVPFGEQIIVVHTDCAASNDSPVLRDDAIAIHTDLGIAEAEMPRASSLDHPCVDCCDVGSPATCCFSSPETRPFCCTQIGPTSGSTDRACLKKTFPASLTVVTPGSFTVTKTTKNGTYNIGDNVNFTIVVASTGPGVAQNVVLNDPLPTLGNLNSWSITSDPTGLCTLVANTLNCPFGDLANGQTRTVTVATTAQGGADATACPGNQKLNNTATVTATGLPPKSDTGDYLCTPPPTMCRGVGLCRIDIATGTGAPTTFCNAALGQACNLPLAIAEVAKTNTTSSATTRTISVHGVCRGDPVLIKGLFNLVIQGEAPSDTTHNGCSNDKGPLPGDLKSEVSRKDPPFNTPTGSNGEVIKLVSSNRVTIKYLNIRDGRFPLTAPDQKAQLADDGVDIKTSTASRAFCNCIENNEEGLDVDGGTCNQVEQNRVRKNEDGIRASAGAKWIRYSNNTSENNDLAQTDTASDLAGRHNGLMLTESATSNNFVGNVAKNDAAIRSDDGLKFYGANGNCASDNDITKFGKTSNPSPSSDDTWGCEIFN